MRTVARFQLTSDEGAARGAAEVVRIIEDWSQRKFKRQAGGALEIKASGREAIFDRVDEAVAETSRVTFSVLEPVEGGHLQTEIQVLQRPELTAFRCTLRLGSASGLSPPAVEIRSPRFLRDVIAVGLPWRSGIGGERVFAHAFDVGPDEISALERLITSEQRRLPLVLISELDGQTLAGDLHERIAADVCGLAHTVRLSNTASWELTNSLGKEWSCYNGAVRLFWPFRYNRDNFRSHPLWTLDRIMGRASDPIAARETFRGMLSRRLIEASTFVADEPAFSDFDASKLRHEIDEARRSSVADGDYAALEESYAKENDALRKRVEEQASEIQTLQANVESLTIALRSMPSQQEEDSDDTPPQTVAEAVAIARTQLTGRIVIGAETDGAIADLNPAAGPPDKLLRYLRTLAELADALASGEPLGRSVPIWLREHGVDCSGDSETAKTRRQPRLVDDVPVDCEFHAKPADGVSPDLCVRIYFGIAESPPKVRIAYIGRHT